MLIALRSVAAAVLVAAVALADRRWGPTVAGLLLGFPIIIGITLLFTMPQGREAVGSLGAAALYGLIPLAAFLVCVTTLTLVFRVSSTWALGASALVWVGAAGAVLALRPGS